MCCAQSYLTLHNPTDWSPPGSSVHGTFQTRILEWVATSFSRETSQSNNQTHVSSISCTGRQIPYQCATWEVPCLALASLNILSHSSLQLYSVQFSCSVVSNSETPLTAAHQDSLSITNSWSLLNSCPLMPSSHLILCHPLLLLSIFPSFRVFSNESVLHIRWPKYWSFSFNISPFNE